MWSAVIVFVNAVDPGGTLLDRADMPLPEMPGRVAGLVQEFSYRDSVPETETSGASGKLLPTEACHDPGPARATGLPGRVGLGEQRAFGSQFVQRGRLGIGMAIAGEIPIAKIVRKHEYEIRTSHVRCSHLFRLCPKNGQASQHDTCCRCQKGFLSIDVHFAPIRITGAGSAGLRFAACKKA